jgi:hypothetical protein
MMICQRFHFFHRAGKRCLRGSKVERLFSFNFAGPRRLEDILKKELVEDKSATEVADIWYTYHENKVRMCACFGFIASVHGGLVI